ncbi:Tyrosine recombinase XerC [subsurface metagenome]
MRKGRWWWSVKLPGETKIKARPLRPIGSQFATKDRLVAEEVAKMIWQEATFDCGPQADRVKTIAEFVQRYLQYAKVYYNGSRELENIRYALMPLIESYPTLAIEDFGPLVLKEIRQKMIESDWCRGVINQRIGIIKRMFKWGTGEQIVPVTIFQGLQAVEGLRRGRSGAKETEPVKPIAESYVHKVLPFTTPTVAAMIELQLLTGMRSTELCIMRPCDIEVSGNVWFYRPATHKTAYRGQSRIVAIGPRGQKILRPFLKRKLQDYCFKPIESDSERGKKTQTGNRYDRNSYRGAVQYAIKATNKAGLDVPFFSPHQLRHTAATLIRKRFGLDAARIALGHRDIRVTDDYAELDKSLALKVALGCG